MGGISSGKPILPLITGPMMPGSFRGQRIGACTDCRNNWAAYRGDVISVEDISALNEELAPTAGTCGVMGTASTMACITAALGLMDLKAGAYVSDSCLKLCPCPKPIFPLANTRLEASWSATESVP